MQGELRSILAAGSLAFSLLATPLAAQVKDPAQIGERAGPPVFGGFPASFNCTEPGAAINDNSATSSAILIQNSTELVADLQVAIQLSHTWVGDLSLELNHPPITRRIIDRPGFPDPFSCSSDDIDAIFSDLAGPPAETTCSPIPPALGGLLRPNDTLSGFNGQSANGLWTLQVRDHATGDVGTLDEWCINLFSGPPGPGTTGGGDPAGPPTTGGQPTPATNAAGTLVLIALFLGIAVYYLRRRAAALG